MEIYLLVIAREVRSECRQTERELPCIRREKFEEGLVSLYRFVES